MHVFLLPDVLLPIGKFRSIVNLPEGNSARIVIVRDLIHCCKRVMGFINKRNIKQNLYIPFIIDYLQQVLDAHRAAEP